MKTLYLLAAAVAFAGTAWAQNGAITVDQGTAKTIPGIGGYTNLGYAFAAGDRITLKAAAAKMMGRVLVVQYPENVLLRIRDVKAVDTSFIMPSEGIVTIRFVSDRPGVNTVNYSVLRLPASAAVRNYNTKVIWEKPQPRISGQAIPRRAKS